MTGALHFDAAKAFDFPPGAFNFSLGFLLGLGAASRVGIYDYLGYYDICYIGDEVKDPGRVIPRSILISIVAVALIYLGINLSIIGVVPGGSSCPPRSTPSPTSSSRSSWRGSTGTTWPPSSPAMVLWTAFGSVFALLLGYSRIPYAAAQDGYFFKVFGRLHPTKGFPYVSLLVIGVVAILCSFFSLGLVIDALITTRILVQFMGQIGAVTPAPAAVARDAAAVPDVALSAASLRGARRMDLPLRHLRAAGHPFRAGHAGSRRGRLRRLVVAGPSVALRPGRRLTRSRRVPDSA